MSESIMNITERTTNETKSLISSAIDFSLS